MKNEDALNKVLKQLADDIKLFIELSLRETDASWDEWLNLVNRGSSVKCWEIKECGNEGCPAYQNHSARCWLTAGTMCEGKVRGEFALKYKSCTQCEVYQSALRVDLASEVYEHVLTLVHSFRESQSRLKALAIRDPLTGLYNRTFFNEAVLNEIERTKRYGETFSIVMLDVDNFKWINDNLGHLFGDKILRDCALLMRDAVRASDVLVRYGGDEFLILIPGGDHSKCEEIVSRVGAKVDEWNGEFAGTEFSLSMSAGCAQFAPGGDIMAVLKEADDRMYQRKKSG